jgi:trans-aconitate 2-methyltransferase
LHGIYIVHVQNGAKPVKHVNVNQKPCTWNSEDYAAHSEAQYQWAKEMIEKLGLHGNESVLDIGCGEGKVTALLAAHLPLGRVIAMDSSPDMIAYANKMFPPSHYPNLSFFCMDATNLEFHDQFDLTFSNAALHWVQDQSAVLRGVREGLKRSGRIFFQMGGKGNAQDIIDVLEELVTRGTWRHYFRGFTFPYVFASPDEYEGWLLSAGLVPTRLELIPKDMTQPGREGLAGWIRTTWMPITVRIPDEHRNRFVYEIVETYIERHHLDADGLVHVPMVRLEVEAVKP